MDAKIRKQLIKILQEGKDAPTSFREVLFPEEDKKMEYELVYGIKQREEDILADTWSVPFQPVKHFGDVKKDEWHNILIFGDNLQALKHILKLKEQGKLKNEDGTDGVRLVYIDPPFGTGDIYDARSGAPAYSAKLQGAAFIEFLRKRLIFLRELLADNGSIYVRIDYHFGHYVKVVMDEVFGKENLINEILVNRGRNIAGAAGKKMEVDNDFILWYSVNNNNYIFNELRIDRPVSEIKWTSFLMAGERFPRERTFLGKKLLPPKGQHFALVQEKVDKILKGYFLRLRCRKCGALYFYGESDRELFSKMKLKEIRFKFYDITSGKVIHGVKNLNKCIECDTNNFAIDYLGSSKKKLSNIWLGIESYSKSTGFPTENSEQLLERIISVSSNPGDLILDCFAGSGTTDVVAEKLGRRWIMCDVSKFAIYTMIKRMLSLKVGIGQKGKPLKPKPFVLYNAGLYFDGGYLKGLDDEEYKKFALELFQAEEKEQIINGFKLEGVLMNAPVHIFPRDGALTEEYVGELHNVLGDFLKGRMFIIAPLNRVYFLQDYIERDGIRYYVLRIPYSVIDELHKNQFSRPIQAVTSQDINKLIESVGFDFIYPPEVEVKYYKTGSTLFGELIIEIKKFEAVQRAKKPIEFKNREALSMVLIDKDYKGKYFDMDYYFFQDQIEKDGWKVKFSADKVGDKIAIIYLDVLGNERFEVKSIKDFKKK